MGRNDVFRWKLSARIEGMEPMMREVFPTLPPHKQREMLERAADFVRQDARALVPRETGELEREVQVFDDGGITDSIFVGVPETSPAIHKARATEYGTWNYDVGAVAAPKTSWPARSKVSAAMPWLRTGLLRARPRILRMFHREFFSGKRARKR